MIIVKFLILICVYISSLTYHNRSSVKREELWSSKDSIHLRFLRIYYKKIFIIFNMKLFESTHTFFYNWSQVSAANWRKYPNDNCPHVVAIDVLDRHVDPETGVLRTERLITCSQTIPGMLNRLCGGCTISYAREVSEIDPRNKVLKMTSCNLSMNHLINVTETVTYTEDPTNSSRTLFKQEARINCGESISRFAGYIENFFVQRFRDNSARGRKGFENVLMGQGDTAPAS